MADDVRFGLWYDFRNPEPWQVPFETLYRSVLDQIAAAEQLGIDSVWLTEHHFCDDGYTPSPLVLAAAIAERTTRMRIGTNLMLLPLLDPIRLAEDSATLSLLSGGRFDLGVGMGYRQVEFDAFGRSIANRPSLLEEGVEVIRRAWSGEPVDFAGRRFRYGDVVVQPVPTVVPKLLVGGMADAAIERVARIADGFLSTQNAHHATYLEAIRRHHGDLGEAAIYAGQWVIIADDPEREWARIGDHALYQLNEYVRWGAFGPPDQVPLFPDRDAIVAGGAYQLWDPETAVAELTALLTGTPQIRDVHFWAQLPGEPVDSGSARIEFLATKVLPAVRQALSDGARRRIRPAHRSPSRGEDTIMRFGMFYVLESPDGDHRRAYKEMLGQIEYAEELGFDSVWLAEHHGSAYGSMPSPAVAAAAVAAITERLRIGIAVSILPFGNPVRIAEDYAMVDVISNGRLDMGVGRGYQPREFAMLGLADQQQHSRAIFAESLDILIGLWENDTFSYQGEFYQIDNVSLSPRPVQRAAAADLRRGDQPRVVRPRREVRPQHHGDADADVAPRAQGERDRGEEAADQGRSGCRDAELPDELADAPGRDPRTWPRSVRPSRSTGTSTS